MIRFLQTQCQHFRQPPQVKNALGLTKDKTSLERTIGFIEFIQEQERLGKQYSIVIFNETANLIGIITLKNIDNINKTSHIDTWIGPQYWGQGYNLLALHCPGVCCRRLCNV